MKLMNRLRYILTAVVGLLVALYLAVLLLAALPGVQRWMARQTADALSSKLGTRVEVGRVRLDLFSSATIDSLLIFDQQGDSLICAERTVATVDLMALLTDRTVRIGSLKVLGSKVMLRQADGEQGNWQFAVDSLKPRDDTKQGLQVVISRLLVRDMDLSYNDIALTGLMARAKWRKGLGAARQSPDSDSPTADLIDIDGLSFSLKNSGKGLLPYITEAKVTKSRVVVKAPTGSKAPSSSPSKGRVPALPSIGEMVAFADINASVLAQGEHYDIKGRWSKALDDRLRPVRAEVSVRNGGSEVLWADIASAYNWQDALEADVRVKTKALAGVSSGAKALSGSKVPSGFPSVGRPLAPSDSMAQASSSSGAPSSSPSGGRTLATGLPAIGEVELSGHLSMAGGRASFVGDVDAGVGRCRADVRVEGRGPYRLTYSLSDLAVSTDRLKAEDCTLSGSAVMAQARVEMPMELNAKGHLGSMTYDGRTLSNVDMEAALHSGEWTASLAVNDAQLALSAQGRRSAQGAIDINGRGTLRQGMLASLGEVAFSCNSGDDGHYLLTANADGVEMRVKGASSGARVPTSSPSGERSKAAGAASNHSVLKLLSNLSLLDGAGWRPGAWAGPASLSLIFSNEALLTELLGSEMVLDELIEVRGRMDENMVLTLTAPSFSMGGNRYGSTSAFFNTDGDSLRGSLMTTKYFNAVPVRVEAHLSGRTDSINTEVLWKDMQRGHTYGSLLADTHLRRTEGGQLSVHTRILPTNLFVADTAWSIAPATIDYDKGELRISDLIVSRGQQFVSVNADLGKGRHDLAVKLNDVEVAYLLGLTNFKPVTFGGKASGSITNSTDNADGEVTADLTVRDFRFNGADLGMLWAKGLFYPAESRLTVKAKSQRSEQDSTLIDGLVMLRDKQLDFRFASEKTNLQFLNKYVGKFIDDLEGTTTGNFHLFGSFKYVQMEADETINYIKFRPKILGTLYTMENQPMRIRPDTIDFTGFTLRDPYGNEAHVKGSVNHHYLFNFNYNIDFLLNSLLTVNWAQQPSRPFWGTVFTDGRLNLSGTTRNVMLTGELDAVGEEGGSALFYNSGITAEENRDFVRFLPSPEAASAAAEQGREVAPAYANQGADVTMDIKVNATPDATLNIVTDPVTHDYMSLRGSGPLQLAYYNKGRFQLNGLYTVNSGNYKLTIKDIIHKNFEIQPGGYLRFQGAPAEADISLKGVHRVNSVSLSDLNVGASHSNSTVGVDCILNFSGKAAEPKVAFDIDFPKANNDENLLLKKFILTEEDRNMQAVYLLSIGRFYTYNYNDFSSNTGGQNQSTVAMTSFLAGTLSGQINNILQDAFHITNWNFGTSIAAGRMGFGDMEVQGSLSGKMFNNRLLFNGNIGYRDQITTYSNNFVGDFNLQWLLNKAGTISLKAYSETNDRYFTKSSLTTQGGGILFQKDFNKLRDFFRK
jgi:hypothetical protein